MRVIKLAAVAALLATPALAQAPSYEAPAYQGPIAPAAPVVDPLTTGTVVAPIPARPGPVGGVGQSTFETQVDSAKGGNAAMPSRLNPNLGSTSGGPSN